MVHRAGCSPIKTASRRIASLLLLCGLARALPAQIATYHLHQEASATTGLNQLKAAGPDAPATALQSGQLRNNSPGEYVVKQFDTQPGVPNASGVIPQGSTVTFALWMRKTSTAGTLYPRAKLNLNSAAGAPVCAATGSVALTTSVTQYILTCTTSSNVPMATSDRFYLWTGVYLAVGPGNQSLYGELDIEGVLNGNYDSQIAVPLPIPAPQITSLTPNSGEIGTPVTIAGSNFGGSQGASTVTFNGTPAAPTSWADTSIAAPVPLGATSGPVMVTVQGVPSNGVNFTAIVGTVSGTVSRASDGALFSGVRVEALQSGVAKLSTTSGTGGAYSITGLPSGAYDVRALLQGYATTTTPATVTAGSTTTVNFSLLAGTPITYFYDELGRLTAVVDPATDSARYSYDATGNLLSITRQSSSQVTILEFNPHRGFPGATVTLFGTGFSSIPSQNTVQFNGVTATVTSATTTQIVATVPAGATTGPVSVTTPGGSATSSAPFVVPSDVSATITPGGPPVTVTIPTPGQNARVTFSGNAGQRVSLLIAECAIAQADVSLLNPDGTTLAGPSLVGLRAAGFIDAQTLPTMGTYTILVDPRSNYTGSVKLTLYNIIDVSASITPGGAPVTVTTTLPGQNAKATFSGTAGRKVSLVVSAVTIPQATVSIQKPDGTDLVAPTTMDIAGVFLDAKTLPVSGTYTILVDPGSTYSGAATLTLYDVVDITSTVTPGGPTTEVRLTTPGQNATWTFTGTTGQRVSQYWFILTQGWHVPGDAYVWLYAPDGSWLTTGRVRVETLGFPSEGDRFFDTVTLPSSGSYTVFADPTGVLTPWFELTLYDVPPDVSGSMTINGPAVNVNIPVRGQNGSFAFDGTLGQHVTVRVTNNTICVGQDAVGGIQYYGVRVTLRQPSGADMTLNERCQEAQFNLPTQTLPVTGRYTVFVDPQDFATGTLDLSVTSP